MAVKPLPCPTLLRLLLRYEPETGKLFWRKRPVWMFPREERQRAWNTRLAGREALTSADAFGYRKGCIQSQWVKAHRVAYAIYHGYWPKGEVDHADRDCGNNRICNLRDATSTQNKINQKVRSDNTTGFRGVFYVKTGKRVKRWTARVGDKDGIFQVGYFATAQEAADACARERQKIFGEFASTAQITEG